MEKLYSGESGGLIMIGSSHDLVIHHKPQVSLCNVSLLPRTVPPHPLVCGQAGRRRSGPAEGEEHVQRD